METMKEEMENEGFEIVLNGIVDIEKNPVDIKEFSNTFISWVEKNGWSFNGMVKVYEDEKDITD